MHQRFTSHDLADYLDQRPIWKFRAGLAEKPDKHAEQQQELRLANAISEDFVDWAAEINKTTLCCLKLNAEGMTTYLSSSGQLGRPGASEEELEDQRKELDLPPFVEKEDHADGLSINFATDISKS